MSGGSERSGVTGDPAGHGDTSRRRAAAALVVLALAACAPPVATHWEPPENAFDAVVLTRHANDQYGADRRATRLTVWANPANAGESTRIAVVPRVAPNVADTSSCATLASESTAQAQEGLALRVVRDSTHVRAITVTKNIYFGATWIFNVHVWDTLNAEPFTGVGSADLRDVLAPNGTPLPFPWRMCARVVGPVVDFKVWPASVAEPRWRDGRHGGQALLPGDWVYDGRPGWFAGHLAPGASVVMIDVGVSSAAS